MSGAEALDSLDSFLDHSLEKRQGVKIACPEEIGLEKGWISGDAVLERAGKLGKTEYAAYLRRRVNELGNQ